MKKEMLFLVSIAIFTMVCFGSVSCSSNDDASVKHQLVGIWKSTVRTSNWRVIELESNGTVHYGMTIDDDGYIYYSITESMEPDPDSPFKPSSVTGHWIYNETDQTISMYTDDGYYSFTYKVSMSEDGKSWVGYDQGKDKTYSFTKLDKSKLVK